MTTTMLQIQLISSIVCSTLIVVSILTALTMMRSYRQKHSFIILIGSLLLALAPQVANSSLAVFQLNIPAVLSIISTIASLFSFMIINFVYMKMFASGVKLRILPTILLIIVSIVAITTTFIFGPYTDGNIKAYPILDLFMLIIIMVMIIVTRQINMPESYFISLTVMFSQQVASMLNLYVFEYSQVWLNVLVSLLPICYYMLLYFILLQWIMDRLLITYQSSILDGLTGLYVRRHFQKKMSQLMQKHSIAIIFCDIDNFKSLNDTKGHAVADQVLQYVATIIKEETAPYGIAGRYGGEELLGGINIDKVKPLNIAERIRARVQDETIVTISVGVSTSKEASDLLLMVKQADEAMYYSKTTGKNKVSAYRSIPAAWKQKTQV